MKLLYITNGINGSGGLERVLSIKASYFADKIGYKVTILSLNNAHLNPFYPFSDKINMVSITVGGNPIQYIQSYRKGIQKIVNESQPDIISVCDDGLKAFFIPHFLKTNVKLIYERHVSKLIEMRDDFGMIRSLSTKIKWWMMDKLAKRYDRFIVLTEGNKKEWSSLQNIEVISNPLSFYSDRSSSHDQKIVICVGKISYQKGQDLLVKAWEEVHQAHPDWQLHLYGKENLSFLDTNNLTHNIKYFAPEKNIEEKYLQSSIYVMSSRFEGFGMVLIEAMACGLPCVSFNCNYGPGDIIKHNENGFLVENGNVTEMAHYIKVLIENRNKRIVMGENAKESISVFSISHVIEKWVKLFSQLS